MENCRTVQLVIKRGSIEVDLTGRLIDFDDAILIAKSEVDEINKLIRKAGAKKLHAMTNFAIFRRKVLHKEWEHQGGGLIFLKPSSSGYRFVSFQFSK